MADQRDTYPLKWPDGWKRTDKNFRRSAPYKVTLEAAARELVADLKRMGARDVVVSSNLRSGLVKQSESEVKDPGVAVYWHDKKGASRVMACDQWQRLRDNVRAVGLTIAAMRAIERSGASALLDRALESFVALPPAPDPWQILGVPKGSDRSVVDQRHRLLARENHPDRGGSTDAMARINRARDEALSEIGGAG
jgi:hypothetical protein